MSYESDSRDKSSNAKNARNCSNAKNSSKSKSQNKSMDKSEIRRSRILRKEKRGCGHVAYPLIRNTDRRAAA